MSKLLLENLHVIAESVGGVRRLRELFLELAVRGDLLSQHPGDETATELLRRIVARKQELVNRGTLRKKSHPAVTADDQPYKIPRNWEWVSFGCVLEKISDGTHHSPPSFAHGEHMYITAKNLRSWGMDLTNVTFVSQQDHDEIYSRCDPEFGDLLLVKDGATTGVAVINTVREPFSMLSSVALLKPGPLLSSKYVLAYLRSPNFRASIRASMTGIAITRITLSRLASFPFPLPPLAEQDRIATRLDELMVLCDKLEEKERASAAAREQLTRSALFTLIQPDSALAPAWNLVSQYFEILFPTVESVEQLRNVILELAVQGRLVPQDPNDEPASELVEQISDEKKGLISAGMLKPQRLTHQTVSDWKPDVLPDGWQWVKLSDVSMQVTDGTHHTPQYLSGGVPFISVKDIDGSTVSFKDCKFISQIEHQSINARCNPKRNDLLICRIGTIGRPTIVDTDRAFSLFVSVGLIKMTRVPGVSQYVHRVLSSPLLYRQYDHVKAGGSHTNKLNLSVIPNLEIPLPPLREQARIVAKVDELFALCDELEARISGSARANASLVSALTLEASSLNGGVETDGQASQ